MKIGVLFSSQTNQKVMAITTTANIAVDPQAKEGQNVTASIPNPRISSTGIRVLAKYFN